MSTRARRASFVGQIVAGHHLVRRLASSASGESYLAIHQTLDVLRLLKVIRIDLRENSGARASFIREAQALARVHHPAIVQLVDFGALPNGWPYLVMEYVDGPSIEQLVKCRPLPLQEALCVLDQVARALQHAHGRSVFHHDLEPANVRLRAGDVRQVKLVDFGLATVQPPGAQADPAVDVRALGRLGYTLLSGRAPSGDPPPPLSTLGLPGRIPAAIDRVLLACIRAPREPRQRCPQLLARVIRLAHAHR